MYSALSRFYDLFMTDSGGGKRLEFILKNLAALSKKQSATGERLAGADLACGTGAVAIELSRRGFDVFGVDISSEMLSFAAQNAAKAGQNIKFIRQDISNFKALKPLDFITCVCDGVNYLKDPSRLFGAVAQALKTGGLFIFDISTEYKLRHTLAGNTFSETANGVTYIWKNSAGKNRIDMHLTFFEQDGQHYKKSEESQTQYIHGCDAIAEMLDKNFEVSLSGEGGKKLLATDPRAYFVAKKRKNER